MLRNKEDGLTRLRYLPREDDEDSVVLRFHNRPAGRVRRDLGPTILHLCNQGITEGFVRVEDNPAPRSDHRPASRGDDRRPQEVGAQPRRRNVKECGSLNNAEAILGGESVNELVLIRIQLNVRTVRRFRIQRLRRILEVIHLHVLSRRLRLAGNVAGTSAVPEILAGGIHKANVCQRGDLRLQPSEEVLSGDNVLATLVYPEHRPDGGLLEYAEKALLVLFVEGIDDGHTPLEEVFRLGRDPGIVERRLNVVEEPREREDCEGAEHEYGNEKT